MLEHSFASQVVTITYSTATTPCQDTRGRLQLSDCPKSWTEWTLRSSGATTAKLTYSAAPCTGGATMKPTGWSWTTRGTCLYGGALDITSTRRSSGTTVSGTDRNYFYNLYDFPHNYIIGTYCCRQRCRANEILYSHGLVKVQTHDFCRIK